MAKRPVFLVKHHAPYFQELYFEFNYFPGFSVTQKQKSIESLHAGYKKTFQNEWILEISSKSSSELGVYLSAFNLIVNTKNNKALSVEAIFQSSKVFEFGGPYKDLLKMTPREAKNDPRLKSSGKLVGFKCAGRTFPITPNTYFYNWLYINALNLHPEFGDQILKYDAFSDIEFNPDKSINCQARAAAIYVSLRQLHILEKAIKTPEDFLRIVYGQKCEPSSKGEQLTFGDGIEI